MSIITGSSHALLPMGPSDGLFKFTLHRPNLSHKRLSAPARPQQLSRVQTSPSISPLKDNSWPTTAQHVDLARPSVTPRRRTMANIFSPVEKSYPGREETALQQNKSAPSMHIFPADNLDYELSKEKRLGSGRWSSVYLARSILASTNRSVDMITPPTTPTRSRRSNSFPKSRPESYAIKVAANRSSIKALKEEATILSHLSLFSGCEKHIVPFHGYDTRNDSIIFSALPASLEDLVCNELSRLDEASRVTKLASIFPRIAKSLATSLAWLHAANVVHADLKPANILLRSDVPIPPGTSLLDVSFSPVLADFTSSFRTDVNTASSSASAMGGGTYDFLSPELLVKPYPPPSGASDVYALAITLLNIIIGTSPYAAAQGNRFHLLEMAKAGRAIDFAMQEPQSEARLVNTADAIRRATGLDVIALLNLALKKSPDARVSARVWCTMF
ncbi:hypothetical protein Vi05172_g3978 [Venturia inaequalis]|nr:hypothetical protein Vi05172_g3978 [Venturia inaequalis]